MPEYTTLRRPSDDLAVLRDQLLRELERLEKEKKNAEEPDLFRGYLDYAQALVWEGVARGAFGKPREILDHLLSAQPFVDRHRPEIADPLKKAAIVVDGAIRSLYLAIEALEVVRTEARLKQEPSATERRVLQALLKHRGEYLRRGDVHAELEIQEGEEKLTAARIGQILTELYHEGLLSRIHGRAQGNPNAAFYALSPRGLDVCRNLGMPLTKEETKEGTANQEMAPESTDERLIDQCLDVTLNMSLHPYDRGIAIGVLLRIAGERGDRVIIKKIFERLRKEDDKSRSQLAGVVLGAILRATEKVFSNLEEPSTLSEESGILVLPPLTENLPVIEYGSMSQDAGHSL